VRVYGQVTCWGLNTSGQASAPAFVFNSVTAGGNHSCGVAASGVLACWGLNTSGQTTPPAGTYAAVDAGSNFNVALSEGGIDVWGG
jgi:alpha-tubulin suppressor-like RCC1 family protein